MAERIYSSNESLRALTNETTVQESAKIARTAICRSVDESRTEIIVAENSDATVNSSIELLTNNYIETAGIPNSDNIPANEAWMDSFEATSSESSMGDVHESSEAISSENNKIISKETIVSLSGEPCTEGNCLTDIETSTQSASVPIRERFEKVLSKPFTEASFDNSVMGSNESFIKDVSEESDEFFTNAIDEPAIKAMMDSVGDKSFMEDIYESSEVKLNEQATQASATTTTSESNENMSTEKIIISLIEEPLAIVNTEAVTEANYGNEEKGCAEIYHSYWNDSHRAKYCDRYAVRH